MAYEAMVTILFAMVVGAAIILYATRPRHGAPRLPVTNAPAMGSYPPANSFETAPPQQAIADPAPANSTPALPESHTIAEQPAGVAATAATSLNESKPTRGLMGEAPTASMNAVVQVATSQPAPSTKKTQRRRSASAKPQAPGPLTGQQKGKSRRRRSTSVG